MGETTEELRQQIEQTRNGLGDTLDAIGDRVSPGRMVERSKNRMTGGVRSAIGGPALTLRTGSDRADEPADGRLRSSGQRLVHDHGNVGSGKPADDAGGVFASAGQSR